MADYERGDTAEIGLEVRDDAGALTTPATLVATLVLPDGVTRTITMPDPAIIADAVGVYRVIVLLDQAAAWSYTIATTSPTQVADGELWVSVPLTARTAAETTARRRLIAMLSPDIEPVLTGADIDALLARARRVDTAGLYPSEVGYVATWTAASLDAAAADGWEIRASRCFDDIDFGEDGMRFNTAQRHKACLQMVQLYRRGATSVAIASMGSGA